MDIILSGNNTAKFLLGLLATLELTAAFIIFGGLIDIILAALRSLLIKPLQWLVALFVLYHHNMPLLVQILFLYFAILQIFPPPQQKLVNRTHPEFILSPPYLPRCAKSRCAGQFTWWSGSLIFTCGIGKQAALVRAVICNRLDWLGVELDEAANARRYRHHHDTDELR